MTDMIIANNLEHLKFLIKQEMELNENNSLGKKIKI